MRSDTSPVADESPSLRERKKRQTRRALVEKAQELFTANGFDATTLDELVDAVDVSKRTFFRNFPSKEDVALATDDELWSTHLEEVRRHAPQGPLLAYLEETILTTLAGMSDDWERRFLATRALADRTPALVAHSLRYCDQAQQRIADELAPHVDSAADRRHLRLLVDITITAWRLAVADWTAARGRGGRAGLDRLARESFAGIPESLSLAAAG